MLKPPSPRRGHVCNISGEPDMNVDNTGDGENSPRQSWTRVRQRIVDRDLRKIRGGELRTGDKVCFFGKAALNAEARLRHNKVKSGRRRGRAPAAGAPGGAGHPGRNGHEQTDAMNFTVAET